MSNLNTETLRLALLQLLDDGYISSTEGCITGKGKELMNQLPVPVKAGSEVVPFTLGKNCDWTNAFITLIQEAQVPQYLENGKGEHYKANNYSEPACKIFRKAIEKEGILYDVLVKSTMLYYKSNKNKFKKAIGNYFVQGDWRSDYLSLLEAAGTGTIEQHIKTELDDGSVNRFELG